MGEAGGFGGNLRLGGKGIHLGKDIEVETASKGKNPFPQWGNERNVGTNSLHEREIEGSRGT